MAVIIFPIFSYIIATNYTALESNGFVIKAYLKQCKAVSILSLIYLIPLLYQKYLSSYYFSYLSSNKALKLINSVLYFILVSELQFNNYFVF